jgi:steroid-22-oyl-CoA synthetase
MTDAVPASTFADVVRSRADDDHVALRFGDQSWTWSQVVDEAATRAAALSTVDIQGRPPHIGVLLENIPDFVFWVGAAALSGSVLVGINSTRRGAELAHDIRHTGCDLIVTEAALAGLLKGIDHGVPGERVLEVDAPAYPDWLRPFEAAALPTTVPGPSDILLLLFSSGSTGAPKAVVCTQGRLGMLARTLAERARLTRGSVSYLAMPLFHGNSIMLNLAPSAFVGSTIAMVRRFSASGFSPDVHRYGVTYFNYVGRALSYVLSTVEDPRDRTGTLELAIGTEASLADVERFSARFGCEVSEGYGSSEGVFRLNRTPDTPADSLGRPVGDLDVRVLDEHGVECEPARFDDHRRLLNPDRAIGEIVAIGRAGAFEGYYRNPEAQTERVRGNDFWSGDLAYRDTDGFFYFAGRSSDWLRVDSENFAAAPIERILERWPAAAIALVYPVPDPRTGDQVMAAIKLRPGERFDPEGFVAFLDTQPDLGPKWRPRFVRLIEEVPTTGNNKVAKASLRRAAWVTGDPVYWRPNGDAGYQLLDPEQRDRFGAEFIEHGRAALMPVPA